MIENITRDLGGVGIFGIISVCLFFIFFTGTLIWAVRLRKPYLKAMRDLPLDGGEREDPNPLQPHSGPETSHE